MARYIDANELQMRLRKLCDTTECNISIMPDVMEVIHAMPDCGEPAVDVAPVVHGEWIEIGVCAIECSVCGNALLGRNNQWYDGELWHDAMYCPNCRAKMDEKVKVMEKVCSTCKHYTKSFDLFPCCECQQETNNGWEPAVHAHAALDAAVIHKAATMDTLTPWIREQLADIAERMEGKA